MKRPFLAGGCFFFVSMVDLANENTRIYSGIFIGGAGGYCPRVQKVTDYLSTSIVSSIFLQPITLKNRQKYVTELRGKVSVARAAAHTLRK